MGLVVIATVLLPYSWIWIYIMDAFVSIIYSVARKFSIMHAIANNVNYHRKHHTIAALTLNKRHCVEKSYNIVVSDRNRFHSLQPLLEI